MEPIKRRWGDRKDGWRLRHTQSFFAVMPHFMKHRNDAMVFFDECIEVEELEKYVRRMRKEKDMPDFSMYHLIIAAALRMFALRPCLNRFIMNGKTYARNNLSVSMTVKKTLSVTEPDSVIKPYFEKTDTVFDVYRKIHETMEKEVRGENSENDADVAAGILNRCPAFLVRAFVNFIIFMDHRNLMTNFINKLSPFHTSFYVTDVGSLGIGPVYHHIYNFGTTSIFLAMGKKQMTVFTRPDGTTEVKRAIQIRFVLDERICDGQYFADAIRSFRKLLKKPQLLETPPDEIPVDTWI